MPTYLPDGGKSAIRDFLAITTVHDGANREKLALEFQSVNFYHASQHMIVRDCLSDAGSTPEETAMAPRIRSAQLHTRTARARLAPRRRLYQVQVAPGIDLGHRRNKGTGTWSVCSLQLNGCWARLFCA
jgi:hypothetical protein